MSSGALVGLKAPTSLGSLRPLIASLKTFAIWAAASAVVGVLVGALVEVGVVLASGRFDWWFVQQSVVFAEAIGLSALVAMRYAFPYLESLQPVLRSGLILITLFGGVLAATLISALQRPTLLFSSSSNLTAFAALVTANALLALIVGIALIAWESLQIALGKALVELREKERIEREFALARDVQLELLPDRPPSAPGLDIAFSIRPAAIVGGDTLDFLELPDGRIGITVGDVVGKGFPAALVMANLQSLVRGLALRETDPARLNAILSRVIAERGTAGRFVTFAYVSLDPVTGEIWYSLAGHHPPVIAGANGVRLLERGGLPLGIMEDVTYESGTDRLCPGETLVLYTDGIVEAPPPDSDPEDPDEYGRDRLIDKIRGDYDIGAERLLKMILDDVDVFTGSQPLADDTTLLVVRRAATLLGEAGS